MNWYLAILIAGEGGPHRDGNGQVVTHHWLLPEIDELIWGTLATVLIVAALWKYAWPMAAKALKARTERIQAEFDDAESSLTEATAEAAEIRQAAGDITAERQRLFAEADAQAEALLIEGRARLEVEVDEATARADADIASASSRAGDEIAAEIARLSAESIDRVIAHGLDEATQQSLIEAFITKVGAGS